MAVVAMHNFRAVDQVLAHAPAPVAAGLKTLGHAQARALLRYQAAELNRWYFEMWEWTQVALGASVVAAAIWSDSRSRLAAALCVMMIAIVLIMRFLLTPEMARLGGLMEFVPSSRGSPERGQFRALHSAYLGAEGLKVAIGLGVATLLVRSQRYVDRTRARERAIA
jgi:predicted lysophospholipase L1 biosynthesis ABC-type transport system permease subunit